VQGLGGALLSPAALSIITTTFPEGGERNKALGVWGAVAGAGGAAGVLLGGVITDSLGWEWVFFVNVPVTLAAAAVASRVLVESRAESARRHFDFFGAVTVTGSLSLLVYTMVRTDANGWGSATTIGLFAASAALLAVFIWWENRSPAPLVPFRIFRLRNLTVANVVGLLTGAALLSMFFFVSLYMQRVLGYSPLKAGLSYVPLTVTIIISAGVASQLTTRLGVKPVLVGGMALVTIALFLFSGISANGSFLSDVLPASLVAGAGLGFAFVPITIASQMGVRPQDAGLASGLINTSQQIGGALGLAVLSTIATSRTGDVLAAAHGAQSALPDALTEGFQAAFTAGAVFAFAGVVLSLTLLRTSRGEPVTEPAVETA
jgi:EmrB/QacA subfamily drug resistance transporter